MIPKTTPAPAPTDTTPASAWLDTFGGQIQSFINGVLTLDPEEAAIRGGLTLLVLLGAMLLIWGLRVLLKGLTERVAPDDGAAPAPKRKLSIGRWSLRIARLAIFVMAILIVLRLWGFDFSDLRDSPIGVAFRVAGRIAVILVIALAALELSNLAIARLFSRIASRARSPRRAAQVRTLAPLISGVITTTVVLIAAMMSLSEIGVEIGPLIAGAGIIGLAIGFGAQTLVKDFLTGAFLILEDIVSVGDVVMIADFGGVVEEMSLRTIKLRDFDGTLHVFPYSEAQVIHNRTKIFSFAVFDLSVDYNADIAKALDLMKEVGDGMKAEEIFVGMILSPIEVVGVDRLSDSAVVLKARIKTAPGKQWTVSREYLKRIKFAFDAHRIENPFQSIKLIAPDPTANHDGRTNS